VLPLVADLVTGQRAVYQYLADSIEQFPTGQRMRDLLSESGLNSLDQIPLHGGILTIHTAEKPASDR
jgi:ubiquinone/menaquinone biosynthesis C-methylase UbiE